MFGIKNARRSAGQHKLVVRGCIYELTPGASAVWLSDDDVLLGDDPINLPGRRNWLIPNCLTSSLQKNIHPRSSNSRVCAFSYNIALEMRFTLVVGVVQVIGSDKYGSGLAAFLGLNQHSGHFLIARGVC